MKLRIEEETLESCAKGPLRRINIDIERGSSALDRPRDELSRVGAGQKRRRRIVACCRLLTLRRLRRESMGYRNARGVHT
jgi:hypothetical protein